MGFDPITEAREANFARLPDGIRVFSVVECACVGDSIMMFYRLLGAEQDDATCDLSSHISLSDKLSEKALDLALGQESESGVRRVFFLPRGQLEARAPAHPPTGPVLTGS
jgi:hypothetical protein